MFQTLDQRRAEYAWEQVSQAAQQRIIADYTREFISTPVASSGQGAQQRIIADYTREAKGAPALIMGSGLMQTLAYLRAKGKPQHLALLGHLCRWLGRTLGGTPINELDRFPPEPAADFTSVMAALHAAPSSLYLRATEETLALLRWIRQFADAYKAMGS